MPSKPDPGLLVEQHTAEWLVAQGAVPGAELHQDADVTWLVQPGSAWSNVGVLLRFAPRAAARRLDTLLARYQAHGRGMGLWVSPHATPAYLPALLRARALRCRRNFPAMMRSLASVPESGPTRPDLEIRLVEDTRPFEQIPHPVIGEITTPRRRYELARLSTLAAQHPRRTYAFVVWLRDRPVGACALFLGAQVAGLHDVAVLEEYQGQGIGTALVNRALQQAAHAGAPAVVLLATGEGQELYTRCGFAEVARFGFWYRSFQRRR